MTGIGRLRTLAGAWDAYGLGGALEDVADQIERERACDEDAIETIRLIVGGVIDDMERHVSGVEGADDSPVARWARELRETMGGNGRDPAADVSMSAYDLLPADERDAIAWVREHGGLDAVQASVEQGIREYGYLCDIASMLGTSIYDGTDNADALLDKLSKRLMPEGMDWLLEVWPKWSNGEYCKFGDWWTADKYGDYEPKQLRRLAFFTPEQLREWEQDEGDNFGYEWDFMRPSDTTYRPDKVEPPAPKVLDVDGVDTSVGDTVYDVDTGEKMWVCALPEQDGYQCVKLRLANGMFKTLDPCRLTHERPDSWERLEEDAEKDPCGYFGFDGEEICGKCPASGKNCEQTMAQDLVRRCRALAERERGE